MNIFKLIKVTITKKTGINIDAINKIQHSEYVWSTEDELMENKMVHDLTKDFFREEGSAI